MRKDFEKLFAVLKPEKTPDGLWGKIAARLEKEERLAAARKNIFFSFVALASAAAFIPAAIFFRNELSQSGFFEFSSLFFSDLGAVAANWREFGMTLLESLPAAGLTAVLSVAFVFFWSMKNFSRSAGLFFPRGRFS